MAKETVPADLETISYPARVRLAVVLGRKSRTNPQTTLAERVAKWRVLGATVQPHYRYNQGRIFATTT